MRKQFLVGLVATLVAVAVIAGTALAASPTKSAQPTARKSESPVQVFLRQNGSCQVAALGVTYTGSGPFLTWNGVALLMQHCDATLDPGFSCPVTAATVVRSDNSTVTLTPSPACGAHVTFTGGGARVTP